VITRKSSPKDSPVTRPEKKNRPKFKDDGNVETI